MSHLTKHKTQQGVFYTDRVYGAPALIGPPSNSDLDLIGWSPPHFLRALYRHHDGLGPRCEGRWLPHAILPWSEIVALTARVRFGEENICWDPADCVLFSHDTSGGGWVFQGRDAPVWRRFDGRTHALSKPLPAYAVLAEITAPWGDDEP